MSDGPKPRPIPSAVPVPARRWLPWALVGACVVVSFMLDGCNKVLPPVDTSCPAPAGATTAGAIVTMAGSGGDGGNRTGDGKCAAATDLYFPSGMTFGADSTLYFCDLNNLRVRHVKKDGTIETTAGGGRDGTLFGPPTDWYLFHPACLLRDPAGNMLISLWHGDVILKLTPGGTLSVWAGAVQDGGSYEENVPASEALLKYPRQMAWDAQGNLYYAEMGGHKVRMIDAATHMVRTVAGTGLSGYSGDGGDPLQAQLNSPYGVAVGPDGTLYIADSGNNRIRAVNPARTAITTFAGDGTPYFTGDGGPAEYAQFDNPEDLRFGPDGSLYVADTRNHCVRKIQFLQGATFVSTIAGVGRHPGYSGDGKAARTALLDSPEAIAFDPQGNLWIADTNNHVIRRVHTPF